MFLLLFLFFAGRTSRRVVELKFGIETTYWSFEYIVLEVARRVPVLTSTDEVICLKRIELKFCAACWFQTRY